MFSRWRYILPSAAMSRSPRSLELLLPGLRRQGALQPHQPVDLAMPKLWRNHCQHSGTEGTPGPSMALLRTLP
jgi:hypothetical protein